MLLHIVCGLFLLCLMQISSGEFQRLNQDKSLFIASGKMVEWIKRTCNLMLKWILEARQGGKFLTSWRWITRKKVQEKFNFFRSCKKVCLQFFCKLESFWSWNFFTKLHYLRKFLLCICFHLLQQKVRFAVSCVGNFSHALVIIYGCFDLDKSPELSSDHKSFCRVCKLPE